MMMAPMSKPPRERGAALIVAMLVVALAATVAARFAFRVQIEDRKLENRATLAQARWVLRAAEHWALVLLRDDGRQNSTDHLGEIWARQLPPVEAEGFRIAGQVEDMQGRFNLNSIIRDGKPVPAAVDGLARLLDTLRLDPSLAASIVDWLDRDHQTTTGEAESPIAPNRPLLRAEELQSLPTLSASQWHTLAPFVTALPEPVAINVNTASAPVLIAATQGLFPATAQTLIASRQHTWFRDAADFNARLPKGASTVLPIGVGSRYFKVRVQASRGRISTVSEALLSRASANAFVWRNAP